MEKDEKIIIPMDNGRKMASMIIFAGTVVILAWEAYTTFLFRNSSPGSGMEMLIYVLPLFPFLYILFPIYFIVLSLRYYREKSQMYIFDKITFYILFMYIASIAAMVVFQANR